MLSQGAKLSAKAKIASKLHIISAPPIIEYPQYQTPPSNQMPPKQGSNWLSKYDKQLEKSWLKIFEGVIQSKPIN